MKQRPADFFSFLNGLLECAELVFWRALAFLCELRGRSSRPSRLKALPLHEQGTMPPRNPYTHSRNLLSPENPAKLPEPGFLD
jgi:hypothetical protein